LGLQIRLTPNLPIDEFVRHYCDDRALHPSEYVCEGVWSRVGVAADGRTGTVCPYFADGDIWQRTLRQSWNGEALRAFRSEVRSTGIYPGCHGCCNLKYVGNKRMGLVGVSADSRVESEAEPRVAVVAQPTRSVPVSLRGSDAVADQTAPGRT
jgi:hypothetical protein